MKRSVAFVLLFGLTACGSAQMEPPREPLIKVKYRGTVYQFLMNEEADCGTLEDGTPYVEANWYRASPFETDPPFVIKGAGGWSGNTYEEPHTWIQGIFDDGDHEIGFAIYGEDRPGFDENREFSWSGATPLGDKMSVEVICP